MNRFCGILMLYFVIFLVSCKPKEPKEMTQKESSFERIYELSEMALLMEDMYAELGKIRPNVIENKNIGTLPPNFIKIHTAEMTHTFERDFEFERFAKLLIETQKQLYDSDSNANRIQLYNNVVQSCLVCHKSPAGCDGLIPRIQKLLIKEN